MEGNIMRVLIINTSEKSGGAAVAAKRLVDALNNNGVKAKMLTRDKQTDDITVVELKQGFRQQWHFLWERWCIFCHLHFQRKHLFDVDIANSGYDVTALREFKEADVIHLHWINQGMLSLSGIRKILQSGKPVVWTMHDMWPATAICHLTFDCRKYRNGCRQCRYMPTGIHLVDLARRIWQRKQNLLKGHSISFVACSRWLAGEAKQSMLLSGQQITAIPNPIDTRFFAPAHNKADARLRAQLPADKRIILFIAQRATNPYKGMDYLIDACQQLAEQHPAMCRETCVAILGGHAEDFEGRLPFQAIPLGYVNDERRMVDIYNSADAFVLPSLSENLPNTIMEAMACGVPCVGFNVGGIPEMIDHQRNGYVAKYRDAADLATGMYWVLYEADHQKLAADAVRKVSLNYSQQAVSLKYIEVYNHALAFRHYKI